MAAKITGARPDPAPTPRVDAGWFQQIEASRFEALLHEMADKINALMEGQGLLYGQIALPPGAAEAKLLATMRQAHARQQQQAAAGPPAEGGP